MENEESKKNFEPKGPRMLAHKAKKGVKNVGNNIRKAISDAIKKIVVKILAVLAPYLVGAIIVITILAAINDFLNGLTVDAAANNVQDYYASSTYGIYLQPELENGEELTPEEQELLDKKIEMSKKSKELFEKSGSLVLATNEDIQNITDGYLEDLEGTLNSVYNAVTVEGYIGTHKISGISYTEGFDINNAFEFMFNSERMNFNRITWVDVARDIAEGETEPLETELTLEDETLMVDEVTNLIYPNSEEDEKELDYFIEMTVPYLQSYVIPYSMFSGLATTLSRDNISNFAYQIIDKAFNRIQINRYTIQKVTRHKTKAQFVNENITVELYKKTERVETSCDEGQEGPCYITVTYYGYNKEQYDKDVQELEDKYDEMVKSAVIPSENIKDIELNKNYADTSLDSDIVYAMVEAETLRKYFYKTYEQIPYVQEDVDAFLNSDTTSRVYIEPYRIVPTPGTREPLTESEIDEDDWSRNGSEVFLVEIGDKITYRYFWQDKLENKKDTSRYYTLNDVLNYIDKGTIITKHKETTNAKTSVSSTEKNYYTTLIAETLLNKIDIINASESVYSDYLDAGENLSENIGYSRGKLSKSYSLVEDYILLLKLNVDNEKAMEEMANNVRGVNYANIIGCNFAWPLASEAGSITSCAGGRPKVVGGGGTTEVHGAIDVGIAQGTPIVASQDGVINMIRTNIYDVPNSPSTNYKGGYGHYVVIKHDTQDADYTYYTLYAHMMKPTELKEGDEVKVGDVIGYVGSTGGSTGAHLHFEIQKQAKGKAFVFGSKIGYPDNLEPILYIQRDTIPDGILNQSGLPNNCGDITNDMFGQNAATSEYIVSDNATANEKNTGTGNNSSGKFVFASEITTAISKAKLKKDAFNRELTPSSNGVYCKTDVIEQTANNSQIVYTAYPQKPSSNNAKDNAIRNMSDLEIISRTIHAEQGWNSEEAGVLVGISILNNAKKNNSSIANVLVGKYNNGTQYNYNCVSDNIFWGDIPKYAQDLAVKACAAVKKGTYVVNDVECISVEGFHAANTIDNSADGAVKGKNGSPILAKQWWGWTRKVILENNSSGAQYTAFYGW